ncbi:MAG: DUF1700 domain-containing protein [Lachnospiraceae bacterium]|nr:DUF1700 domain-containing protein [Lachnospiraceae bacterium]
MGKNEFLTVLRGQMTGRIPTSEVNSQLEYYLAYIDSQVAKGMSEEQVVEELGDPRLIAKTLIESTDRAAEAAGYDGPYRKSTDSYDDSDGVNTGEFGRSYTGDNSQYSNNYSGQNGNAYGGAAGNQRTGNSTNSAGIGCGGLSIGIIIAIVILLFVAIALIRFTFWVMPGVLVIIGIILLVRYLGRRK